MGLISMRSVSIACITQALFFVGILRSSIALTSATIATNSKSWNSGGEWLLVKGKWKNNGRKKKMLVLLGQLLCGIKIVEGLPESTESSLRSESKLNS